MAADAVSKVYSCAAQSCAGQAADGGVGGLDQSTNCLASACVLPLSSLYFTSQATPLQTDDDVCFDCILLNMLDPTETIPAGQATCTASASPAFMFQGQTPLLVLSKYPFNSTKSYMYPSTGIRRGILKVQVQFEDSVTVDVFCTQLASPQLDSSLPYVGAYGHDVPSLDGGPGENGWEDEQTLQAKRAVSSDPERGPERRCARGRPGRLLFDDRRAHADGRRRRRARDRDVDPRCHADAGQLPRRGVPAGRAAGLRARLRYLSREPVYARSRGARVPADVPRRVPGR